MFVGNKYAQDAFRVGPRANNMQMQMYYGQLWSSAASRDMLALWTSLLSFSCPLPLLCLLSSKNCPRQTWAHSCNVMKAVSLLLQDSLQLVEDVVDASLHDLCSFCLKGDVPSSLMKRKCEWSRRGWKHKKQQNSFEGGSFHIHPKPVTRLSLILSFQCANRDHFFLFSCHQNPCGSQCHIDRLELTRRQVNHNNHDRRLNQMVIDSTHTDVMDETTGEVYADAAHNGQVTSPECHSQHQILQAQPEQEAQATASTAAQDAWQSQTFQVYECNFDNTPNGSDKGIVKAFSTGTLFNTTVGESRTRMGIQGDNLKMTNGGENNFFKALKW